LDTAGLQKEFDKRKKPVCEACLSLDWDSAWEAEAQVIFFLESYEESLKLQLREAFDDGDLDNRCLSMMENSLGQAKELIKAKPSRRARSLTSRVLTVMRENLQEIERLQRSLDAAVSLDELRVASRHQESINRIHREVGPVLRRLYREVCEDPPLAYGKVTAMQLLSHAIDQGFPSALKNSEKSEHESSSLKDPSDQALTPPSSSTKRLSRVEMEAMGARLTKPPGKASSKTEPMASKERYASYDEQVNCSFDLKLEEFRASLKPPPEKKGGSKGFHPVNQKLGAKQARDGLHALREHGYSLARGLEEEGFYS